MKEQIEELRGDIEFLLSTQLPMDSEFHKEVIKNLATEILNCLPNNDWLEYPKHKPSERGQYVVAVEDGFNIEIGAYGVLDTFEFTNDIFRDSDVIAFKPIPVEPFVKEENEYMKKINNIIYCLSTSLITLTGKQLNDAQEFALELKAKIENGELI